MVLNKINRSIQMLKSQVKNMHKTSPIVTGLSIYDLSGTTAFSNLTMRDHAANPKRTKRKSPISRKKTHEKREEHDSIKARHLKRTFDKMESPSQKRKRMKCCPQNMQQSQSDVFREYKEEDLLVGNDQPSEYTRILDKMELPSQKEQGEATAVVLKERKCVLDLKAKEHCERERNAQALSGVEGEDAERTETHMANPARSKAELYNNPLEKIEQR
ncbi:uncharacterized protein LOC125756204 [Rhipicephalus sanguineus]|uniref:uncharacterized protein LOC125756204 n=1 Tax=Rhipicephalus sanguineus TaxID=34632 RepID=UPI0020C4DA87|nr:uncharacterized protein LOC125756204 [Rhipicephalus sanguineus]